MFCSSCSQEKSESDFRPSELRRLDRLVHLSSKGTSRIRAKRSDVLARCRKCLSAIDREKWAKIKARGGESYENRKARHSAYHKKHKERHGVLGKEHYRTNIRLYDYWRAKARAKRAGATMFMSLEDWETIRRNKVCTWCQIELHPSITHMDHVIPLCEGGQHTIENVVVSCANCNHRREWDRRVVYEQEQQNKNRTTTQEEG